MILPSTSFSSQHPSYFAPSRELRLPRDDRLSHVSLRHPSGCSLRDRSRTGSTPAPRGSLWSNPMVDIANRITEHVSDAEPDRLNGGNGNPAQPTAASGRDERGRFAPGNPGGPGRPPRATE